ncbi:hypothetical protein [Streptomyces microflavus]|uniref:hypothetical protein n=1 Tax=Streptomyces microflavus TaxID=1919 RepID=UPI003B20CC00
MILNDRATTEWQAANGYDPTERGEPMYACIDGQQRISTAIDWFEDQFAVPASWFDADDVTAAEDTADGPYVRWSGLTLPRQRHFANRALLAVAAARVATIQEEAAIYLLVNGVAPRRPTPTWATLLGSPPADPVNAEGHLRPGVASLTGTTVRSRRL